MKWISNRLLKGDFAQAHGFSNHLACGGGSEGGFGAAAKVFDDARGDWLGPELLLVQLFGDLFGGKALGNGENHSLLSGRQDCSLSTGPIP